MANKVQHYRSYETGTTPATLLPGELAVNFPDKRMWFGDAAGVPVEFVLGEVGAGDFFADGSVPMTGVLIASTHHAADGEELRFKSGDDGAGGPIGAIIFESLTGDSFTMDKFGNLFISGTLSMGTSKITNLADPTATQDAATKAYVDAIPPGGTGDFMADGSVPMSGDLITNGVINSSTTGFGIWVGTQLMYQVYESGDTSFIKPDGFSWLDWSLVEGARCFDNLNLTGKKITSVADPVDPQDAATKNYVDTEISIIPPGGTGDFMSDGSVPLIGPLQMGSNSSISATSSANIYFKDALGNTIANLGDSTGRMKYYRPDSSVLNQYIGGNDWEWHIDLNMMGLYTITRLKEPTAVQDATTKAYVDTGDGVLLAKIDTLETQLTKAMALITALQAQVDAL